MKIKKGFKMTKLLLVTALISTLISSASANMGFGGMMKDMMDIPKEVITSTTDSMKDIKDSTTDSMKEIKNSAKDVNIPTIKIKTKETNTSISNDKNESKNTK